MTISIVGSGNMAYQLTGAFVKAGYEIQGIFSRNESTAKAIGKHYGLPVHTDITKVDSDIVVLCVSDDAIGKVAEMCKGPKRILVHTSGSTSLDVIKNERKGVFYPLQTMTKVSEVDFSKVPIFVSSDDNNVAAELQNLAKSLSDTVYEINDNQRLHLHLSAVITNNFINHLAVKAKALLESNGLDYSMITPLLEMTFDKIAKQPYNMTQTGPAKRGDQSILEKHKLLLANDPNLREIYTAMSNSIYDFESKK